MADRALHTGAGRRLRGLPRALVVAIICISACTPSRRDTATGDPSPTIIPDATVALLEYVIKAFPSTWDGVPAEVFCVNAPAMEQGPPVSDHVRPASECRLELRRDSHRVRHTPSGSPGVIYTFGPPRQSADGTVAIDFTWFGAYHFSAGYRCVLAFRDSAWITNTCVQTSDYRGVG